MTTEGGTEWELETAWQQASAARVAGDIAAEALAMRRFSEGLRNSSMGVVGQVLGPIDRKIDAAAAALTNLAHIVTNARQADLNWRTEERTTRDAQSDRLYAELDKLIAASEESGRRLGKLHQDFESFRTETQEKLADADAQRLVFTADMGAIRAELRDLQATNAQVKADLAKVEANARHVFDQDTQQLLQRLVRDVQTLKEDKARFDAVEVALAGLSSRITDALPPERGA